MKTMKTTLSAIAIFAIAGPALAADFTALDLNADGQISFDEYKTAAIAEGKTVTLAAQEFTRMAQGDTVVTQDEFFLADALAGEPYALQPVLVSEPLSVESAPADYEPMEFVEPVETSPDATEMIEPPIINEDTPTTEEMPEVEALKDVTAPIVMEKPMDINPVVAGEVETSIEVTPDGLEDITPIEGVETELLDSNPELELLNEDIESEDKEETLETEDLDSEDIY